MINLKRCGRVLSSAVTAGVVIAGAVVLLSCSSASESPRKSITDLKVELETSPDHPREVRPSPASSGIRSDPENPNGAPGPSRGLGISNNRY